MAAAYHYPLLSCSGQEVVIWCNAVAAGVSCFWPEPRGKAVKIKRVVIYADGASLGNPGPAAIGATIKSEQGRLIASISERIGRTTNNQAEYKALIAALEEAIRLGAKQVSIGLDSQLVVRQIRGEYRVKNQALKPLYQRVKQLQSQLQGFNIRYVPRQQNREADNLANMALKRPYTTIL